MSLLLNILWFFFGGGFLIGLGYAAGGVVLCLTVVGIPFGLQCLKLAGLAFFPFGKTIEDVPSAPAAGFIGTVCNIVWLLVAGIWIFLSHIALGVALGVTVIGIPFAFQHFKFALLALAPFGKRVYRQ